MNNRTRLKPTTKKVSTLRSAQTHEEWSFLMQSAIDLADRNRDPRLAGLRAAQAEGRSEQFLRNLGIICPVDLGREFPPK